MAHTSPSQPGQIPSLPKAAIFTLALLTAVGPLAIDMYLAALPDITAELKTTESLTQLTLSAFMVGMALGQLIIGPLSDKVGRIRPLYLGVIFSWISAVACIFAPTISFLIAARCLMGIAGATGLVLARAIVADSTQGKHTAKLMGLLMMINGFAPVLAPVLGGLMLSLGSWRLVFVLLTVFMTLSLVLTFCTLQESLPEEKRRKGPLLASYRGIPEVLALARFRGFMLTSNLAFAAFFAYISGSSYLLQNVLGLTARQFTLVFAFNSLGIVAMTSLVTYLVGRVALRSMLTIGVFCLLLISTLLTIHFMVGPSLVPTLILLLATTTSAGLIFSNASSLALIEGRQKAGAASAIMGTVQSVMAAIASPLATIAGSHNPIPLALTMLGFSALSALALVKTPRQAEDWKP